jgi:hypothetical protein
MSEAFKDHQEPLHPQVALEVLVHPRLELPQGAFNDVPSNPADTRVSAFPEGSLIESTETSSAETSARLLVLTAYTDEAEAEAVTVHTNEFSERPILTLVPGMDTVVSKKHEKSPKMSIRPAVAEDVPAMVDVDMRAFKSVFVNYDDDLAAYKAELTTKFQGRFDKVGGEWMPVLERDGKIVGFMTCCPTNKSPEEFKSWEETTDDGTLESTYDPEGKNVYVVTLSVLPEGTAGKDMLFANQIGKMMREGYETGFFESRLPGLRSWMKTQCNNAGIDLDALSDEQRDTFADTYFNLRVVQKGKEVRQDRLIRLYERVGCKILKLVPDAYQDKPSMNYGAVCVYDGEELFNGSVLPFRIPDKPFTRKLIGAAMQAAARSPKLTAKLFS